jgi:alpha-L-rhamnosidase
MKKMFFQNAVSGAVVVLLWAGTVCDASLSGRWIGCDSVSIEPEPDNEPAAGEKPAKIDAAGTKWIWTAEDTAANAATGIRYFRKRLVLASGTAVRNAQVLITADDKFVLRINGKQAASGSSWSELKRVDVTKLLKPGENRIEVEAENGGDEPNPAGLLVKLVIVPETGNRTVVLSDDSWEASAKKDSGYGPARIVGPMGCSPWGTLSVGGRGRTKGTLTLPPAKYLRKGFALKGKIRKATLKTSALGWYEIHLNGERVGRDYFAPGWTDYNKRVYYNTYDVTAMLKDGDNAIGAVLTDGWYAGYVGYRKQRENYGKNVRVNAEIVVEYSGGSTETVITDGSWRASGGPILEADILMGEVYDATREIQGWDEAGFDDKAWSPVDVTEMIAAKVEPYPTETVKVFREIRSLSVTEPKDGVFVFDMGANIAGFARLKVKGKRGTRITLAFGERLLKDGTILKQNLRSARAEDTYVCKGEGIEIWEPRFTFHGFQYVSMTGFPGTPDTDAVTGIELTSATEVVGSFACSDERLNKLYRNIIQTQRANFIDIPTDCPQRDERLGWTGDAQAYVRTACLNMDVQSFFGKWLVDLMDAQLPNGDLPKVAPLKVTGGSGGPAWADAGIICPWAIYEVYGDKTILEKHYDAMARFMAFREKSMTDFMPPARFHCFGDWLSIGAKTPKDVIFSAYTAGDARIMAKVAAALGKNEDVQTYKKLYENIKAAFNQAYVAEDGRIKGDTQTCYVMALWFDLVDGDMRTRAEEHLIERIRARDWHLSTGFVGTRDLMHVLTKIGRTDVAYRLMFTDTYPSWLFPVKNGATSIWERWDSWTPEKGFQNPGMNSFSHYAYGAVGQWMFENIGGIKSAAPGYEKVVIRPVVTDQLDWAKVSYKSIRGLISVEWQRDEAKVVLDVEIPADTVAQVFVPGREKAVEVTGGKHRFTGSMIP